MGIMITTGFNDLLMLDNVMRAVIFDKYNVRENEYEKLVNVVSSKRKAEDTTTISDLGRFTKKDEGADISYTELIQGYDKRITNYTYSMGLAVTPEMLLYEQYGIMKKRGAAMGRSAALTWEYIVANIFNYSTSTTDGDSLSTAGGDGLALLSASHPLLRGSTASNILAVAAALSYTSLQDVIDLIEACVSDSSMPQALKAKNLVVPRKLRGKALELLNSPYRPDNAENAINVVKEGWSLTPVVNHFFTSQSTWYVQADEHDLTLQKVKDFSLEQDVDPWNRNVLFLGTLIGAAGFNDWRGISGSNY